MPGGVVSDDAIRCLIISHHLLNTNEIILIHHTRCGMLAFTDDLLKAGLEGDPAAETLLGKATGRAFTSCKKCSATPSAFHAFRGQIQPLDSPRDAQNIERLGWDVRRGMSAILNHPWIPASGPDAVTVRGFVYDVDTGTLEEVSYPGRWDRLARAAPSGKTAADMPSNYGLQVTRRKDRAPEAERLRMTDLQPDQKHFTPECLSDKLRT
jgi:carbonic anhydrase